VLLQYVVAGLMWAPALAAAVTRKVVLHESLRAPEARLRLGGLRPYLLVMVIMPGLFAAVYAATVALGLGDLDLSLQAFLSQIEAVAGQPVEMPIPALAMIAAVFASSLLVAPFVNSLFAFGEEYGWRGFLLPKLLPLGRGPAYLIGGIIWGLWHAPLVLMGFNYPGFPWLGVAWMCGLTLLLGIFEGEWTLKYDSVLLASFIHGAFNAQAYGVWKLIVPNVHPLLGGITGLVGFAGLALLAAWAVRGRSARPEVRPVSLQAAGKV
jgi:hypothetical protein